MLGAVYHTDHVTLFMKSLIANKLKAELADMGADIILHWTNLFKDGAVDINVFDTRS
jgi:NTP pyrophosphatase (non-canonical NTP hydrolase)